MEDTELGVLLRSALSIVDIDQLRLPPNDGITQELRNEVVAGSK